MSKKALAIPPLSRLETTKQAEARSKLSRRTLHRLAEAGVLTKYYLGSRVRWDSGEVDALVSRRRASHLGGAA